MLMDETENLLKDIEEKAKSHTDEKLNEEQIRTVKNLLIKGFKIATLEDKEDLITSSVDVIKFEFIPKEFNKNKTLNTVKINEIQFKF